jgi:pimeloyl-ACP methyl ester carboxylesterase
VGVLCRLRWAAILSVIVLLECGVLAVDGGRCPLTDLAARFTADRNPNFDIYLPNWLAEHNKVVFGWLFVAGELVVVGCWLRERLVATRNVGMKRPPKTGLATEPFSKTNDAEVSYRLAYQSSLRLWPSECECLAVPTRFGHTHVIACGPSAGEPVFLLPAMGLSATMWYATVSMLAKEFRCYAADFPSDMGLSDCNNPPSNRPDWVSWLRNLLDTFQVPRASFVGASYGSFLALNFAIAEPGRVNKLVLSSPAASIVALRKSFYLRIFSSFVLPGRPAVERIMEWIFEDRFPHDHPVIRQLIVGTKSLSPRLKVYPQVFTDSELVGISVPVYFLFGDREVCYSAHRAAERVRRVMRSARIQILPNAGHLLVMEHSEKVNQRIAEFLRG